MKPATRALAKVFAGHPDAYGLGGPHGGCVHITDEKWADLWVGHCEGTTPIGTYCMCPGNVTRWGCIDVDDIPFQFEVVMSVVETLEDLGAVPFVELSRRKGFHVWWFYAEPVEAWAVRLLGLETCRQLNVTLEVNPKQDELSEDRPLGNYVRAPYPHGWEKRKRQCFIDGGYLLTPQQFLADLQYTNPLRTRGEAVRSPLCSRERALGFQWPSSSAGASAPFQRPHGHIDQEAAEIVFQGRKVPVGDRDNQLWTAANLMQGVGMMKARAIHEMERIWARQVEQGSDYYPLRYALSKVDRVFNHKGEKPPREGQPRPLPDPKVAW